MDIATFTPALQSLVRRAVAAGEATPSEILNALENAIREVVIPTMESQAEVARKAQEQRIADRATAEHSIEEANAARKAAEQKGAEQHKVVSGTQPNVPAKK